MKLKNVKCSRSISSTFIAYIGKENLKRLPMFFIADIEVMNVKERDSRKTGNFKKLKEATEK